MGVAMNVQLRFSEIEDDLYPTSDGKPMAETDLHRDQMFDMIETLKDRFAAVKDMYVSGNLLVFYEEGNPRKHVSPDCFAVRGVPKKRREHYLIWREKKAPEVVIEFTSKTTKSEDIKKKFVIYRDLIKVREYFLFDPTEDYLHPPLQGYTLINGEYARIQPMDGRLASEVLGLHLFQDGNTLRLWDPVAQQILPTPAEARGKAKAQAEAAKQENERLRKELDALRRKVNGRSKKKPSK
jgi:Uma2 family endonuclease